MSNSTSFTPQDFKDIYTRFDAPISTMDCGVKCGPYNERGVPFCCDLQYAVPTAYLSEWQYLKANTNLWREWHSADSTLTAGERVKEEVELKQETPEGMILIACLGHKQCQRNFRSLTCRQFPFFPYVDSQGSFLGLSYYWDYEDLCWVISNMHVVTDEYITQMIAAFEEIFKRIPGELENYRYHSERMRDVYNERRRAITLLHRNGHIYKITSHNERLRRVPVEALPKYGPYKMAAALPFPDEVVE
jgi:hypothetical protein